jgi:hypothetical protein
MADPIKKITLADGTVRYRTVVDAGLKPDGTRRQLTITKDTKTEAKDERARIIHQRQAGTLIVPSKMTVSELLDVWLETATRDVEEGTASNYDNAVRPIRRRLGKMRVQQLTEQDVEAFVDWMVTEGRQRGASLEPPWRCAPFGSHSAGCARLCAWRCGAAWSPGTLLSSCGSHARPSGRRRRGTSPSRGIRMRCRSSSRTSPLTGWSAR